MPDGRTFREDLELSRSNCSMVIVYEPQPLSTVVSPVTVRGEAIGNWYFEASFPMRIEDANGNELGTAVAQAQGEWMTEEFVSFRAELNFATPLDSDTGTLVLEKDNPSGLPENEDELHIPIKFR